MQNKTYKNYIEIFVKFNWNIYTMDNMGEYNIILYYYSICFSFSKKI